MYIAKLFKVDCCTIDKLVRLITEIQTILVQYGSGCLGGGGATGAQGAQGPAGTPIPVTIAAIGNSMLKQYPLEQTSNLIKFSK